MAGRLSKAEKNKPIDPKKQEMADQWMKIIGDNYNIIKNGCRINSHKQGRDWDEDVFSDSICLCYSAIQRNGLKDLSVQGCKNYLFNSYKMNVLHNKVIPYNARRVDDEEVITRERIDEQEASEKAKTEIFNDFSVMYLLNVAEQNCDTTSFYTFRLKYLMEKMSYQRLVKLTKIKNAKARVKSVMEYLKENVTEEEVRQAFEDWQESLGE